MASVIKKIALAFAISAGIILGALAVPQAEAKHHVYLPLVPNTPLMQEVIATQDYTYCVDARAQRYPNFVSQLHDVVAEYTLRTGIRATQVPWAADGSCQVQHNMPDGLSCNGWAAHIFYASRIVVVEYCYQLGYTDWRSAQGHELGHGLLGLHEQYDDTSGGIGCTRQTWTVMDCGSGVSYPTTTDVERACAIIKTHWCGKDGTPPPCPSVGWSDCTQRWHDGNGWSVDPVTHIWWNPSGTPEWTPCNADGLRFNLYYRTKGQELWAVPGWTTYDVNRGYFIVAGAC